NCSVKAIGTPLLSYQWWFNGSPVIDATGSTLVINNVQTNHAGSYEVVVSNPDGRLSSSKATLTVTMPPVMIVQQPEDQTVLAGSDAVFTVLATGSGVLDYQWWRDGKPIQGANRSTLRTGQAGTYGVVVSGAGGWIASSSVTLTVVPFMITLQP